MTALKNPCETCKRPNSDYKRRGKCRCPLWKQYFREEWKDVTLALRYRFPNEIEKINLSTEEE